eukprot:1187738-Prorocentrum_minimum.AAC.3
MIMCLCNDKEDETEARTGVGVFSRRTNQRLSFRTIVPMSILHAELAGITCSRNGCTTGGD